MNNASRIIEAQRERESSLAGGEARARPRSGLLKGETGARSRRTLIRPGLGFAPPTPLRPVHRAPRAPSSLWNPVFSRRPRGGWECGWCWGVQVCAVGGTAAPQPQTLVPQARWHKNNNKKKSPRRTAEGNSGGEQLWTGSQWPHIPRPTQRAQCQYPAGPLC